ncbi:MAG: hypothetical protein AAB798_01440 [Patescibacteria group bacterium]
MNYVVAVTTKPGEIVQLVVRPVFIFVVHDDDSFVGNATKFAPNFPPCTLHNIPIGSPTVSPSCMTHSTKLLISPHRLTRFIAKVFLTFGLIYVLWGTIYILSTFLAFEPFPRTRIFMLTFRRTIFTCAYFNEKRLN